ncbi:MAG TPA: hypothetical protein VGC63_05880, partial [Solirubrobacterales bacterium]
MKGSASKRRPQADCERATGIAALGAAVLIFLAGRRSGSSGAKGDEKTTPETVAPELTKAERVSR